MSDPSSGPLSSTSAFGRPRRQAVARALLSLALFGLGVFILQNFLRPLLWAPILVIATWPLYVRVERALGPGRHGVVLPVLFTLGTTLVVVVPLVLAAIQAGHEAQNIAKWLGEARKGGIAEPGFLQHLPAFQAQVDAWWAANLADPDGARALIGRFDRDDLMSLGRTVGSQFLHRAVQFAFTLLTLFFLYRDGRRIAAQALVATNRMFGPAGERVARQIVASIHGTVDGLVLVSLGIAVLLGAGYALAGTPHPVLLAGATFVGAMVPLGATVVLVLAAGLALAVGKGTVAAAALFAFGVVVIFVADHFVRPGLIGNATRLPFLWVLLGILGGVETFGVLGLFLGPAVMAALILLWREWVGDATSAPSAQPAPQLPS